MVVMVVVVMVVVVVMIMMLTQNFIPLSSIDYS